MQNSKRMLPLTGIFVIVLLGIALVAVLSNSPANISLEGITVLLRGSNSNTAVMPQEVGGYSGQAAFNQVTGSWREPGGSIVVPPQKPAELSGQAAFNQVTGSWHELGVAAPQKSVELSGQAAFNRVTGSWWQSGNEQEETAVPSTAITFDEITGSWRE